LDKAFAAEKRPSSHKAKGFNERTIEMPCTFGLPDYDIVEVINNANDPEHKALLDELNDPRNRLLIYRLLHYHEQIPNIKTEFRGRERQLWNPLLRVFQNTPTTFNTIKKVIVEFVNQYREEKFHTQTAFLVRMISNLVKEKGYTLGSSEIWDKYIKELPGGELIGKTTYTSPEYGEMSHKRLNHLLQDQFKARPPRHTAKKRELVFDKTTLDIWGKNTDWQQLRQMRRIYH
jgi:hypothetical protein